MKRQCKTSLKIANSISCINYILSVQKYEGCRCKRFFTCTNRMCLGPAPTDDVAQYHWLTSCAMT